MTEVIKMNALSFKEAKDRVEAALADARDGDIPRLNLIKLARDLWAEGFKAGQAAAGSEVDFEERCITWLANQMRIKKKLENALEPF